MMHERPSPQALSKLTQWSEDNNIVFTRDSWWDLLLVVKQIERNAMRQGFNAPKLPGLGTIPSKEDLVS